MPANPTVKDILYALEYLNAELVRRPADKPGAKCSWTLEPDSRRVPEKVAEAARSHIAVVSIPMPAGEVRYVWRKAAA